MGRPCLKGRDALVSAPWPRPCAGTWDSFNLAMLLRWQVPSTQARGDQPGAGVEQAAPPLGGRGDAPGKGSQLGLVCSILGPVAMSADIEGHPNLEGGLSRWSRD